MIVGLRGLLDEIGPDCVLVNVGGVVYQVFTASSTFSALPSAGSQVSLHTHLHMREDGVTLYGFASRSELQVFQLLLTVGGVGPRSALALLSAMSIDDLVAAIASDDTARLSSVTGIGKRTAARIALELKAKVGQVGAGTLATPVSATATQLLAALTTLGYSSAESASVVRSIPNLGAMELEEALREALRALSSSR